MSTEGAVCGNATSAELDFGGEGALPSANSRKYCAR